MSKLLSESDVKGKLAVSKELWSLIEPLFSGDEREVNVWTVDGAAGMFWEFRCAVRCKGKYKKPVLQSEGWLRFVAHKGLAAGDKIVLEAVEHKFRGTRFVLTAQRLSPDDQHWFDL